MQIDIEAGTLELDLDTKIEELIEEHAWDSVSCNTQTLIEQELADRDLADDITDLLQDFLGTPSDRRCILGDRFAKAVTMVIDEVGAEASSPNPLSNAHFEDAVRSMVRDELWRSAKLMQSRLEDRESYPRTLEEKESDASKCK